MTTTPLHVAPKRGLRKLWPRSRRRLVITSGLGIGGALALAATAVAVLVPSSGTGYVKEGGTTWTVTLGAPTGPALVPGTGTDTLSLAIVNPLTTSQVLTTVTAAISNDGSGNVENYLTSSPAVGCLSSWFVVSLNSGATSNLPAALAGGDTDPEATSVTVTETSVAGSQNACIGVEPEVIVTAQ